VDADDKSDGSQSEGGKKSIKNAQKRLKRSNQEEENSSKLVATVTLKI
jgi:hypothetical protein